MFIDYPIGHYLFSQKHSLYKNPNKNPLDNIPIRGSSHTNIEHINIVALEYAITSLCVVVIFMTNYSAKYFSGAGTLVVSTIISLL